MTLTKCRAPVSVVSDIVMEERSWGTFLSSYLEIISSPPPHSPLAHAVIRLPSKTPLRACFLGSDQIPQLFSFPLMSSLKGASYCLPPSSHCVYSSQTRKNWLCASPLFVLPMVFTVPPPPAARLNYSRGWGQTKLVWLKHGKIKAYLHLVGPCGHTHEVTSERSGEAGPQMSLPPVTHNVSLPSFRMMYCLARNPGRLLSLSM